VRNFADFPTRDALMEAAADELADALHAALGARGHACAALSGGSTPEPAYALLAARDLDWANITFALADERFVPPAHAASNERMLRRALAPALAKGATLLPMYAPASDVHEAADRAEARYAPLNIDIALMGMGEDGHTASWFPETEALAEALDANTQRTIIAVHAPQAAGAPDRLTLTFSALCRVPRLMVLITGIAKRDLVTEAAKPASRAPVGRLFEHPSGGPHVLWAE
jgi:6-phosphogluconolactonase